MVYQGIALYRQWKADRILAETNNGGDLVEGTLRAIDRNVAYESVRATRGKFTRAEPVSALYEQGKVHHVGKFPELEEQLCAFTPDMKGPARRPGRRRRKARRKRCRS
jgi:phage terminase large subunit-like protein